MDPAATLAPLPWPPCGHGATDSIGCRGIHVPGHARCLAHLEAADRAAHLAGLAPDDRVDHRGTPFTEDLLHELLTALRDPITGRPRLGAARFDRAQFSGAAGFDGAQFTGAAWFDGAQFTGTAWFRDTEFSHVARFRGTRFSGAARFERAQFTSTTRFKGAQFSGAAAFDGAQFTGIAWFDGAQFTGTTRFGGAQFTSTARFDKALFKRPGQFGPLTCNEELDLSGAVFESPVIIEAATARLQCVRTRWLSTATLRLRYATVDLSDAVLEYPVAVTARPVPFPDDASSAPVDESVLTGQTPGVRLASIRGVDAAHLALTDIDLSACRFAGAFHLDQLRLEGRCPLALAPAGVYRRGLFPARWTPRRTLAEEHQWRATRAADHSGLARGWMPPPNTPGTSGDAVQVAEPAALAPLYRQLRKAFEDGKNEPDAADFYYGEMEMRRHDTDRPRAERTLLAVYWALSGYGLRASRAMAWLALMVTATFCALLLWGLPNDDPKPETTGRLTGQEISLTTDTPDPRNPTGPLPERFSGERAEKALRVVFNSVIFRSSGQNLTTAGTYVEMGSRLVEPVLLGLAALAVRGRVKR